MDNAATVQITTESKTGDLAPDGLIVCDANAWSVEGHEALVSVRDGRLALGAGVKVRRGKVWRASDGRIVGDRAVFACAVDAARAAELIARYPQWIVAL